jgi:hypothetical protein
MGINLIKTILILVFFTLYFARFCQPMSSFDESDFEIAKYFFILINPLSIVFFTFLSGLWLYQSLKFRFSFIIPFVLIYICFLVNSFIFYPVFYYFRDTVIPIFYPYSRKVNPVKFQKSLSTCVPEQVKYYNSIVSHELTLEAITKTNPELTQNYKNPYGITDPKTLDQIYHNKTYFPEALRICYQQQPAETVYTNPFYGTDPRDTQEFKDSIKAETIRKSLEKNQLKK